MSAEDEQSQSGYEDGSGGPGAPTTLTALEVCFVAGSFKLSLGDLRDFEG